MRAHVSDYVPFPAEVLHELARQFDRVPFNTADAGHMPFVDAGQQMLQAVAEFVEQRDHVVVREQRGLVDSVHDRAVGEVAHQMCDGRLHRVRVRPQPSAAHVVHPGAAAFAAARRRVQVELAGQLRSCDGIATGCAGNRPLHAVEADARVPHGGVVFANGDVEQRLDDLEQAGEHGWQGEILLDLLLAVSETGFLELFADVWPVRGLWFGQRELRGSENAQVPQVLLGKGPRPGCEVAQELDDTLGRLGHLRYQRELTEVLITQKLGLFLAQGKHLENQLAVVKREKCFFRLVGRTCDVGLVQGSAQCPRVCKLHHGQITRHLERELVAFLLLRHGRLQGALAHVLGYALHFRFGGVVRVAVGRVQRVLAEFLSKLGLAFLDSRKTVARNALQFGTTQHEVAQGVLVRLALLGVQQGRIDRLVLRIEPLVGAQPRPELGHLRQRGVIGSPQLGRVGHAVEMAHRAPGAAQLFRADVEHGCHAIPVGRKLRSGRACQGGLAVGQQLIYRRTHMGGPDLVEQRDAAVILKQRVHGHRSFRLGH